MKRKALITLILGTALAVAPAAHAVALSEGGPVSAQPSNVGMSKAEYRALTLRSEALNQKYGLSSSSTLQPVTLRPDILGGDGGASTGTVSSSSGGDSFAWNAAIGGAALVAAMILALAFAVGTRRRHRLSF
jgi:hypothetical protein